MKVESGNQVSLYDRLGGRAVIDAAIGAFYFNVLDDERVSGFFRDVDMVKLIAHQRQFFTVAFGGPDAYQGLNPESAHRHLAEEQGLGDEHFDAMLDILRLTFNDLGIAPTLVDEAIVVAEIMRSEVWPYSAAP